MMHSAAIISTLSVYTSIENSHSLLVVYSKTIGLNSSFESQFLVSVFSIWMKGNVNKIIKDALL